MAALASDLQDISADLLQEFGELAVLSAPGNETRANPDTGSLDPLEVELLTEGNSILTTEGGVSLVTEASVADPTVEYDVYVLDQLRKPRNLPGVSDVRSSSVFVSGLNLPELTTRFRLSIAGRERTILGIPQAPKVEGEFVIYELEVAA